MLSIMGQSAAIAHLQRVIAAGRMAATWIFSGPPGVGKYRTAIALARTCLCENPRHARNQQTNGLLNPALEPDFDMILACDQCESCRAIDHDAHPDLHLIYRNLIRCHDRSGKSKGTTLSIDVIRGEITGDDSEEHRVEPKLYKRSQRGRGKWFIIDEADLMEPPAQNALLKALEEPPPQSFLVMIATSPAELLATIRSRSQWVSFRSLPPAVLVPQFVQRGLTQSQAKLLARLSDGSLGRAVRWLSLQEPVRPAEDEHASPCSPPVLGIGSRRREAAEKQPAIFECIERISLAMDNLATGRAGAMVLVDAVRAYAEQYARMALREDPLSSKDRAVRDGAAILLGFVAAWLDDRLRYAIGSPIEAPLPSTQQALPPAAMVQCLDLCQTAQRQVDMNAHVGLLLAATATELEAEIRRCRS